MSFWKSLPTRWRRLRELSWSQRFRLAQALVLLPVVAAALRMRGYNGVRSWLDRSHQSRQPLNLVDNEHQISAGVAIVEAAARLWRANCLQRSLTLQWILCRDGIDTEIILGTSKDPSGRQPRFHAWVEHRDRVINDQQDIRAVFQVFESSRIPPGADFD